MPRTRTEEATAAGEQIAGMHQKTKPVYDAYCKVKNIAQYRTAHEGSIILHEAAKALKSTGISGKLPGAAALQAG